MDVRTVLKGGILGLTFVLLLPCRTVFTFALHRAHKVYDNLDWIPHHMLMKLCVDILAMLVFSLVLTSVVLAGGIWSWQRLAKMRLRK